MNEEEKRAKIAAQIERIRKIAERIRPQGERRALRWYRKAPIRKVLTIAIFNKHYADLRRHWLLEDLGLHKSVNKMKNYKQWTSK